jgi:murein DD-endopeptidase MepM/ murein hydrolase activator NlpD
MGARRRLTRATTVLVAVIAATALTGPPAGARQPTSVEDQITAADAALDAAQAQLAETFEAFSSADAEYKRLSAAVITAQGAVTRTKSEADAAAGAEAQVRVEFDEFTSASYRHGSALFSARAYLGASSPSDLLDRASMITVLAGDHGEVLDATAAAVDEKTSADRDARAALDELTRNRDAAANAKSTAEQAYNTALQTQDDAKAETARLAEKRAALGSGSGASASGDVVRPATGRLTSTYGARGGEIHFGIDIANSIGTPILSAMAGEVIDSGPASGFGLWVRVRHDGGLITVYGHINESLVSVGQRVGAGEQIATMGNRGQSTGPHLHFEVHQDGAKIDPLPFLRSRGVSV